MSPKTRWWSVALGVAGIGVATMSASVDAARFPDAVAAQASSRPTMSPEQQKSFADAWANQPRVDLGIQADGAAIVIVKFNDYECPGCREAEVQYQPVLQRFEAAHPGAIKYVVKDWPWNATCNFNTPSTLPGHEASCNAAAAARIARDHGKYQEMADWLYANQGTTPAAVRDAAARIVGVTDFDKEYALELPEIRRDIADGGVLQINSTPTFFVNGVRLPSGIMRPEYLQLALTLELTKAR